MSINIKFGTDGWRGRIADDYTFANVRRCAQGFSSYLLEKGFRGEWVVVGFDKRFHSDNFAISVAEVLAANGLRVYLTDDASCTSKVRKSDSKAIFNSRKTSHSSYSILTENVRHCTGQVASYRPRQRDRVRDDG